MHSSRSLQPTLSTQKAPRMLPHRWASHSLSANEKQSLHFPFVSSHKFLSARLNSSFGKKNEGGHINFSQAAAVNQRHERTRKGHAKPTGFALKGEGMWPSIFPALATSRGSTPSEQPSVQGCSLVLCTRGLWPYSFPLISLSALHCKDIHTLLFSCQELPLKNFLKKAELREGFYLGTIFHILFSAQPLFILYGNMTHLN